MNILALQVNGGKDPFLVLAVEMGCGPLPLTLSSGKTVIEYNYILTRLLEKGTLLALLMRANNNNGTGCQFKLSIWLQSYFIKQSCKMISDLHSKYQLVHLDIKPDNIVL